MEWDGLVCWWVGTGSELGIVDGQAEGGLCQGIGSELGTLDRQAEGGCVKELDGWVQQQIGIAWSVGDE